MAFRGTQAAYTVSQHYVHGSSSVYAQESGIKSLKQGQKLGALMSEGVN